MDWVEIGDYQAARVCLQETPQTIERDLWISFCLYQCGDYSEALKHYAMIQQQAKQMDSAQAYGQLCLLKMYEKVKDAPKTKLGLQIQKVSDVLFSGNCSSTDPIVLSYHYFHQGQHSKCLQSLREIKHHRQDLMTAMLLVEAGHLDKAMERLDRYEEQEGISAMSSNVRACSLYLSGQSMEAIQLLSPIAHAYPHHALFRHNVALFQESSHQMQEWERCPHPQSQLNTALLHLQQDHPSTGLDVLQAINIYSPTVQYCKGAMAYEAASANALSMEDALAVLEEACQLPGKEGRLALAILKLHENKYEEALSLLDTSSTVYQQIACNRAQVLCRLEQYKDALECFDAIPMTQLLGEWPLLHGYVISCPIYSCSIAYRTYRPSSVTVPGPHGQSTITPGLEHPGQYLLQANPLQGSSRCLPSFMCCGP